VVVWWCGVVVWRGGLDTAAQRDVVPPVTLSFSKLLPIAAPPSPRRSFGWPPSGWDPNPLMLFRAAGTTLDDPQWVDMGNPTGKGDRDGYPQTQQTPQRGAIAMAGGGGRSGGDCSGWWCCWW
jgi:hypothetical protein